MAGLSTCDDGLVIDLSRMTAITVDPARRTAVAEPGLLWRDFDKATQEYGLAVPGGEVSDTGIAGLTLGGGIGWLGRKFGLSCDNLRAVTMVTASGDVVRASAEENTELFWGIRGAGANFGIVTPGVRPPPHRAPVRRGADPSRVQGRGSAADADRCCADDAG